jgi:hypothetical protein
MPTLTRTAAVLSAVTLCALAPVTPAHATAGKASTETTFVDYDQNTRTLPAGDPYCSVPVDRIYDGRVWTRTTTYADGSVLVHAWVSDVTYTLVNRANGKQLSSKLGGTEDQTFAPDGTLLTDVVRGNDINFTVPGGGRLTGYAGQESAVFDADGNATLTKQTHNMADSIFPAACAYLA